MRKDQDRGKWRRYEMEERMKEWRGDDMKTLMEQRWENQRWKEENHEMREEGEKMDQKKQWRGITKHPNSDLPKMESLTVWMKTLLLFLSPSTTMKLRYIPVSLIWTSLMVSEQSPNLSRSSETSARPRNSSACQVSSPICSYTVSTLFSHWTWQTGGVAWFTRDFQLQGSTASLPTVEVRETGGEGREKESGEQGTSLHRIVWLNIYSEKKVSKTKSGGGGPEPV